MAARAHAPSAAAAKKFVAPLAMHRAAAVRRRESGSGDDPSKGPVDFLARLELLEREEAPTAAPPLLPHPPHPPPLPGGSFAGAPSCSFAGPARVKAKRPVVSDGASSDAVLEQLRQMEAHIDELRTRKRERTPPEKQVGVAVPPLHL